MKHRIFSLLLASAFLLTGCGLNNLPFLGKGKAVATVGNHELSLPDFNYYYVDAVTEVSNSFADAVDTYTQFGLTEEEALEMITGGLDLSQKLTQLIYDESTGESWADYFAQKALSNAQKDYALYDTALAAGFRLSAKDQAALDNVSAQLNQNAKLYGYPSENAFVRATYGTQATADSYMKYVERGMIADAYFEYYVASLTFTSMDYRSYEGNQPEFYNSYSYAYYRIEDSEHGNANQLANDLINVGSFDEFERKVADQFGDECTIINDVLHTSVKPEFRDWMAQADTDWAAVIPFEEITENGESSGYYAVYLIQKSDNTQPTASVRHLLVIAADSSMRAAARKEAEGYLEQWQSGDATEESFADMVSQYTDDTASSDTGGLYEQLRPTSSFVEPFLSWSVDTSRKPGDTGIVETEFGYHIMYFVGRSQLSYRDQIIDQELRTATSQQWLNGLTEGYPYSITAADAINLDIVSLQN